MPHDPRRRHPVATARPGGFGARARLRGAGATLALVLALAAMTAAPDASAQASSRNEAIAQALAQSGGRGKVLGVREERDADGVVYAVKVLSDGRVRVYRIRGR